MIEPSPTKNGHAALRRLQVKGYRSIQELDLPLGPVTVLIGQNGAGKSNILSVLLLAHALVRGHLKDYSTEQFPSLLYRGPGATSKLSLDLDVETPGGACEFTYLSGGEDDPGLFRWDMEKGEPVRLPISIEDDHSLTGPVVQGEAVSSR